MVSRWVVFAGIAGAIDDSFLPKIFELGACRDSFFVFVSDRSRSGLTENLGQIRFSYVVP